jgi:hypothetical protein
MVLRPAFEIAFVEAVEATGEKRGYAKDGCTQMGAAEHS